MYKSHQISSYICSKVSCATVQHLPGPRDPASHGRAGGAAGHGGGVLLSRHRGVPGGLQEELLLPGDEHTTAGQYSVGTEEVGFQQTASELYVLL